MRDKLEIYSFNNFDHDSPSDIISRTRILIEPDIKVVDTGVNRTIMFIFDTGATTVSLPARSLGFYNEKEFVDKYNPSITMHGGIVKGVKMKYYILNVDELRLGTIVLRNFPVHISFDERVAMLLFGMSAIGLFEVYIDPISCVVKMRETRELARYTHNNLPITDPLSLCRNEFPDFYNEQLIESNYINKLVNSAKEE